MLGSPISGPLCLISCLPGRPELLALASQLASRTRATLGQYKLGGVEQALFSPSKLPPKAYPMEKPLSGEKLEMSAKGPLVETAGGREGKGTRKGNRMWPGQSASPDSAVPREPLRIRPQALPAPLLKWRRAGVEEGDPQ